MTSTSQRVRPARQDERRPSAPHEVSERSLRLIGCTSMSFFALMWAIAGSGTYPALRSEILGGAVMIALLILIPTWLLRRSDDPHTRQLPDRWWRNFQIVGGTQFAAISLITLVAVWTGTTPLIPPLVALVVGIHFVPLRYIFRDPTWRVAAVGLILVAVTGVALFYTVSAKECITTVTFGSSAVLSAVSVLVAFMPLRVRESAS